MNHPGTLESSQLTLTLDAPVRAWNPYFRAYATAHRSEPQPRLDADRARWRGGVMTGYMLWMAARWREWREAREVHPDAALTVAQHADFGRWLDARADELAAEGRA